MYIVGLSEVQDNAISQTAGRLTQQRSHMWKLLCQE